jgi:hypothetical membrane protein
MNDMIDRRTAGILGVIACILFWLAMLVLGALRPSYSHVVNAVSELGAIGTPRAVLWNIFGFIIPGLLLAIAGKAIVDSVSEDRPSMMAGWLLPAFGLLIAAQGLLPAVMAGGEVITTSWLTRGHLIASLVSGVAWLVALLLLVGPMKRSSDWRGWHLFNIAAVVLVILLAFVVGGRLPGGLAQRLVDAVVFAWFLVLCVRLILLEGRREPVPGGTS